MAEPSAVANAASAAAQRYLQYIDMPTLAGLQALAEASSDLLRRTAELPDTEQGLLNVLREYRSAVYTFLAITGGVLPADLPGWSGARAPIRPGVSVGAVGVGAVKPG